MKKHLVSLLAGAAVLVPGCGSAGGTVSDGRADTTGPALVSAQEPHPTAGAWPAYDVADYTYVLRTACFCADRGVPVIVTVRDGMATNAVYAHHGRGHAAGDPAGDWMRVTVNDIIDAANTKGADQVRVRWPAGRDHPTSVWVDRDAHAADDEIGYSIRHVVHD